MRIENAHNLPDAIVAAVSHRRVPQRDVLSITELISPCQQRGLLLRHWDDLHMDAMDLIAAFIGTAVHDALAKHAGPGIVAETMLTTDIDGITVRGTPDSFEEADALQLTAGTLTDWKTCSSWKLAFGDFHDWTQQTNAYAVLLRRHGKVVSRIEVVAFVKDWSRSKADRDRDYPQQPVVRIALPLWPDAEALTWLRARVGAHVAAMGDEWAPCTPEERWEKPAVLAVYKGTNQKATKLYAPVDRLLAEAHAESLPNGRVEVRPGERTRCLHWCSVAPHCGQWAADETNPANRPQDAA